MTRQLRISGQIVELPDLPAKQEEKPKTARRTKKDSETAE